MFPTGVFSAKKVTAQIFLRLYLHEFLSKQIKTYNIYNRHYELYIIMTAFMQLFIVREIRLFKAK